MRKASIRAVASALAFAAIFGARSASADYNVITTWTQKFQPLTKPTELAGSGVYLQGSGWDLDLPEDFTFRYYGETITYIRPHGQGVIGFNRNEYVPYDNYALPYNGTPYGMIAPWWEYWARYDQDPFEGGIFYKIEGEGDREVLKVEWMNQPYYYCYVYATGQFYTCDAMKHFSYQVWIYESDGISDSLIQFHYAPIEVPDNCSNGNCLNFYETYYGYNYAPYNDLSGTVGLENRARNQATYGLACKNNCLQSDWPANTVIMFGQPSGPELLPSIDVHSLTSDAMDTTLSTTTHLRNIGALNAADVTFAYYLSVDGALDTAKDTLFATHEPVLTVPAGTTSAIDDTFVAARPAPGWYHVCLFADSAEVAAEAFEENNKTCTTEKYIVGVDFTGSITVPSTAGPGDDLLIDLTITNVGYEAADLDYRILLSADGKPSADDIELHRPDGALHLEGQESYAENQLPLFIPSDALGTNENEVPRFLLVSLDPADQILEADERNNVLVSDPVILIKADLRVDRAALDMPDGCFFGRPVTVTMDISNSGAARARAFDNALVISDNGVMTSYDQAVRLSPAFCTEDLDCAGTLGDGAYCLREAGTCTKDCGGDSECVNDLGDSEGLTCFQGMCRNLLAAYDSTRVTFSGLLPVNDPNGAPLTDGVWYFGAITDFYDQVNEGNEANNARPAGPAIECHSPAPDFIATSLELPTTGAAGEQLAIRRVVKNRGNLDGSVTWKYYLSSNDVISSNDIALKFAPNGGGAATLEAERSEDGTDVVLLPSSLAAGVYHLGIVLDANQQVHELSEENNTLLASGTVAVKAAALRIGTSALPPATVQVSYLRQLVATGGAGAYTWTATTPPLPPGLRMQTDGVLTGKPAETGSYVFGVRVQSGGSYADGLLHLAVLPPTGPLTVSTDRLPAGYVDVSYRVELAAVGGLPPYAWSVIGRPPQGISLKNNTLTGTPEIADGSSDPRSFKVQVKDSQGTTAERELSLPVLRTADLSIQTTRIQDGLVGQPYQQILRAAGGEPPYEFEITGLDRSGLSHNSNSDTTALISGIPEAAGYFEMTVRVEDQTGQRATQTFKFAVIGQAIQVQTDRALPVAKRGQVYPETQLIAGAPDVQWELFAGELPPGIDLGTTGLLSGTVDAAAEARTYTFLARASDDKGGEGFGSFSIVIEAERLEPRYKVTKTGCGSNAAGGVPSGMLLPVLGAALLLLRKRR